METEKILSIQEARKTWQYRLVESLLGIASLGFLGVMVILSIIEPELAAIILIIYSFLWVIKFSLNAIYTIYTYKQVRRWELFDWDSWSSHVQSGDGKAAKSMLVEFRDTFKGKIDWHQKLNSDIRNYDLIEGTKFQNPLSIYQVAIFSIYNESITVIQRSLRSVLESAYPLDKLYVVITQEARIGESHINKLKADLQKIDWVVLHELQEADLDIVYSNQHSTLKYQNKSLASIKLNPNKLNVFFTLHPDGLVGEIKGKASNEDWGGRQASLLLKVHNIDPEKVLVTSLDADSHVGKYFFHNVSYRYALNPRRDRSGYQPVHVYSNNFFDTGIWQRQVATQNTLTNMMYLSIEEETHFFAIYTTPMSVLQDIDFWVREVIGEDYMIYVKCLAHFKGDFDVIPFYGVFEGDAVEADDYIEAIVNQYKQLQRWTWGGVESFPYIFKRFFMEPAGKEIDIRKRIKYVMLPFSEHFFWASTPLLLSVGVILPQYVQGELFRQEPVSQNLSIFSQYFVWISFVFVIIFSYITYRYVVGKAIKNQKRTWYHTLMVALQFITMPLIFGLLSMPALDSQIRGMRGKYLGYWVTPKK